MFIYIYIRAAVVIYQRYELSSDIESEQKRKEGHRGLFKFTEIKQFDCELEYLIS